jgi:hypothetical protein
MDAGDKLAAATLAASRCAALGHTEPADYFAQYVEFVRLFEDNEKAVKKAAVNAHLKVMDALGKR